MQYLFKAIEVQYATTTAVIVFTSRTRKCGIQSLDVHRAATYANHVHYTPNFREACDEAFEKWRKVAGIDFMETNDAKKADIVISFEDFPIAFMNGEQLPLQNQTSDNCTKIHPL